VEHRVSEVTFEPRSAPASYGSVLAAAMERLAKAAQVAIDTELYNTLTSFVHLGPWRTWGVID
jgi:hypothetical protein